MQIKSWLSNFRYEYRIYNKQQNTETVKPKGEKPSGNHHILARIKAYAPRLLNTIYISNFVLYQFLTPPDRAVVTDTLPQSKITLSALTYMRAKAQT